MAEIALSGTQEILRDTLMGVGGWPISKCRG
jgi:hypothetical protein